LTTAVIGTGGWGETTLETDNCYSLEQTPKNAQSPSRLVHYYPGVRAGRCVGPRLGKCVPKGVLLLHYQQQYVIGLLDRHYPSRIEVHTDPECDGMSLGRNR
jgi:hypothetical protein